MRTFKTLAATAALSPALFGALPARADDTPACARIAAYETVAAQLATMASRAAFALAHAPAGTQTAPLTEGDFAVKRFAEQLVHRLNHMQPLKDACDLEESRAL